VSVQSTVFSTLYKALSRHRTLLFAVTLAVIALAVFTSRNGRMTEDIGAMLPDDSSAVAKKFALLQQAPFSKRGIITLTARSGMSTAQLLQVADHLAAAMTAPFFTQAVTGPNLPAGPEMVGWFLGSLPLLANEEDLKSFDQGLSDVGIRAKLERMYKDLQTPTGWAMKGLYQADPLDLRLIAFTKLKAIKLVPNIRIEDNHFVSADGLSSLIVAETDASMTDYGAARRLLDRFDQLVKTHVPPGVDITFVSGHRYAVANAEVIKKDVLVVVGCSILAMFLLSLLFLRSWRAIFIFLVPTIVLTFATAAILLAYQSVSAVTVGFASVLLGITDDFPLYIYFAIRKGRDVGQSVAQVARPLLFSGATIVVAFAVLLFSNLPGQRQIGLFSIVAIAGSVILSLIVVPHVFYPLRARGQAMEEPVMYNPKPLAPGLTVAAWLLLLALSLWQATHLGFNGDLKSMSYIPEALVKAEENTRAVWGDFRSMSVVFSRGTDLETSLKTNDFVFERLGKEMPEAQLISIAPILPSLATQKTNLGNWAAFWEGKHGQAILDRLSGRAVSLGFSRDAFRPFTERLSAEVEPITLESVRKAGLGSLAETLLLQEPGGVSALTLVSDTPRSDEIMGHSLKGHDITVVSPRTFRQSISREIVRNLTSYVMVALSVIVLMLIVLFRDIRKTAYALIPVVTGLVFMLGAMAWLDITFNIFNIVAAILVIGLAVDFGIFMVYRVTEGHDLTTDLAVLLGGLTTVAGVGMLVLARHPALHSIGTTVLLGLGGAIPSALLVIPALYFMCSERGKTGG
jgi:uncharacterized protein